MLNVWYDDVLPNYVIRIILLFELRHSLGIPTDFYFGEIYSFSITNWSIN
jgi:hypothetical protein